MKAPNVRTGSLQEILVDIQHLEGVDLLKGSMAGGFQGLGWGVAGFRIFRFRVYVGVIGFRV